MVFKKELKTFENLCSKTCHNICVDIKLLNHVALNMP